MSAFNHGSQSRANAYSENRCSNFTSFDPWWSEIQKVYERFDKKIARCPDFPKVVELPPSAGFLAPCHKKQIEAKLETFAEGLLTGLRAIFILPGTKKQLRAWNSSPTCYGQYWNSCVFLHAHPVNLGTFNLDSLRDFFLHDVLVHEIGHHLDDRKSATTKESETFAETFVVRMRMGSLDALRNDRQLTMQSEAPS